MDELIRRGESIERAAWGALYRGVPRGVRKDFGLQSIEKRGATFLSAKHADHLFLNRVIGLGSVGPCSRVEVARAVRHYRRRGIERFWFHLGSDQRYSALPGLLGRQGVVRYPRSWMKFALRLPRNTRSRGGLVARVATLQDVPQVSEILEAAFDLPPGAGRLLAGAIGLENWHLYVIEDGHRILAAGALFVRGVEGYLAFAGTRPVARRRGCQTTLIDARIELAERLGCRRVFTETGLPVQGEPNSSYRNMLRLGFDELCVRDNFAPEGTKWSNHPSSGANERSPALPPRSRSFVKAAAPFGS